MALLAAATSLFLFWPQDKSPAKVEARARAKLQSDPSNVEARLSLFNILDKRNALPEATVLLQDGLRLSPADPVLLKTAATAYFKWAERGEAPEKEKPKYEKSMLLWRRLVESGANSVENQVQLAESLIGCNRLRKAIALCEPLLAQNPDNPDLLVALGCALKKSGKYEKALPLLTKSTELAPNNYRTWRWLAVTQEALGDDKNAAVTMRKAFELCPEERRKEIGGYASYAEDLLEKTPSWEAFFAHFNLAERYGRDEGRPDRAAFEYEACIPLLPPNDERTHEYLAWAHDYLGTFRNYVDDPDGSLEHALKAVDEYLAINKTSQLGFAYESLAGAYDMMASRYPGRKQEYLEKQLGARENELKYARESQNDHLARHALSEKAITLFDLNGIEESRLTACRKEMRAVMPTSGPVSDCSYASLLNTEARLLFYEKNYAESEKLYSLAATYYGASNAIHDIRNGPTVFTALGYLAWKRDDLDTAVQQSERAIERLTVMRNKLGADQFRRQVGGKTWSDTFSNLILYCGKKKDTVGAFNYCEQYKARALLDLLGSKVEESRQEQRFQVAQAAPSNEDTGVAAPETGPASENHTRDLMFEETTFKRLPENTDTAKATIPSFISATSFQLEQLQPLAADINVVTYLVSADVCMLLVLTKDKVSAVELEKVSESGLTEEIKAFQSAIGVTAKSKRDLSVEASGEQKTPAAKGDLEKVSQQLYKELIEPALPYLTAGTVCICPDGVLNYLPFEALSKDGKYFAEEHTVFYAPSTSILKLCMDRNQNSHQSILALGNPNLQNPAFRLFNAESEVNMLKEFFPRADVFTGDAATETAAKEHAGAYDVLHFACHGELNLDDAMLTSLRLAPDAKNDGYLHAGEVFDMNLKASLVVLSACNTGLGELTSGNELMGLTRSFLYAGAPAIIASLWTVDDKSTALLMREFYKNWTTMNKAEALRQAKLAVMKDYPNPFYWAAFCLQGDYR
jgi:CHAT domain-containing protein/tetratricopeptide (TPR) repeat protein